MISEDADPTDEPIEPDEPVENFEDDEEGFSLEELGAAYQHIVARSESGQENDFLQTGEVLQRKQLIAAQALTAEQSKHENDPDDPQDEDDVDGDAVIAEEDFAIATPEAIIEAALFVGQPNGKPITSARLASIMRDMQPDEVETIIASLNQSYRELRQGFRIVEDEQGYQMVVAPEVESIRHVFTGKVRETRLAQPAIEVLAMVAYQPGISAAECTDRRGRESGPLLNQMVRRRLVEMRREPVKDSDAKKPKMISRFYPAERLLVLLGLESLEDLPQVEETHMT